MGTISISCESFERVERLNYSAVTIDATMEANLDDVDMLVDSGGDRGGLAVNGRCCGQLNMTTGTGVFDLAF
jgi:hypothetical protein